MNHPMCVPSPQALPCLDEAMEWRYRATLAGTGLAKWRLMLHTMVPLVQCYGGGLEHDCSRWDELYEEDDGKNNAWNGQIEGLC